MENNITKKNEFEDEREELINFLNKLFSNPPSSYGYKHDIEVYLNDVYINNQIYFNFIIDSLTKETRNKEDLNLITSYLFFMQEFIRLLNGKEPIKKETQILNELLNLSTSIFYLKIPKNVVLMRYGEKGSKAYINLNGEVDILIKISKSMKVNERDYLYYLACLIKYNEFALINLVINENFFNFPLLIYDDLESKAQINSIIATFNKQNKKNFLTFIKGQNNEIKKIRINPIYLNNKSHIKVKLKRQKSLINPNIFMEYFKMDKEDEVDSKMKNSNLKNAFKLSLKNEELKTKIEPYIISSKQLLDLFDLKYLDKDDEELNNCSTEQYINRISIKEAIKEEKNMNKENETNEKKEINDKNGKNEKNEKKDKNDMTEESNKSLLVLTIYTYTKVISLGKGNLFGELALRNPQAVRTATIITSTCCHFSYLNKSTYNNCLKLNTELHLKKQFII